MWHNPFHMSKVCMAGYAMQLPDTWTHLLLTDHPQLMSALKHSDSNLSLWHQLHVNSACIFITITNCTFMLYRKCTSCTYAPTSDSAGGTTCIEPAQIVSIGYTMLYFNLLQPYIYYIGVISPLCLPCSLQVRIILLECNPPSKPSLLFCCYSISNMSYIYMYLLYQKLEQRECSAATCTCLVEHENNIHSQSD